MKETAAKSGLDRDNPATPATAGASLGPLDRPPQVPDHELLRLIGRGSYGEVWLARNKLGTLRAIKIIHRAAFEEARPFEREFKGIQKFEPISRSHEGLVDILQVGGCEEYFYYVMELADDADSEKEKGGKGAGGHRPLSPFPLFSPAQYTPRTLRSDLKRHGRLPVTECVRIGLSLASALAHLHQRRLVHRDIKPSNIIFVDGAPKLADIGLVADLGEAHSFVGTQGFIPPEGPGTPQADLYSLGKVLYELSTGKDRHDFPELPENLRDLPDQDALIEFNAVLVKACASDPRQRYQSAQELHDDLALLQRGQSVKRQRAVERRFALAKKAGLTAAAIALLATGAWLLSSRFNDSTLQRFNAPAPVEVNSIAVLPFVNESGWKQHEYLSDALSDETMNALTNCAGLRVAPRSAVLAFKRATNDLRQIGQQLGVRTVLAGSMRLQASTNLHLTARLINGASGAEIWSAVRDGHSTNMGALQREVAQGVAQALGLQLSDAVGERLESNLVRKVETYHVSQEGMKYLNPNTKREFTEAVNLFNQALALDPRCAMAYVGLGNVYAQGAGWHAPPKEAMPTAKSYLLRALEIDDSLVVAHGWLGVIKTRYDYDWVGAREHLQRAMEIDRVGSLWAWQQYLWVMGTLEEAEALARENWQRNPAELYCAYDLGLVFFLQRRFDEAFDQARWLIQRNTNYLAGFELAMSVQAVKGKYQEALALAEQLRATDDRPDYVAAQGYLYARMGRRDDALKMLAELEHMSGFRFVAKTAWAVIYNGLDDKQRALDYLEQTFANREEAPLVQWAPLWDSYRSEPRFIALLKKVGLEQ